MKEKWKKNSKDNKTKSWSFEKINKIEKSLPRLIEEKREKLQTSTIKNEKEVTTDTAEIQRILRDKYKLYYYYCMTVQLTTWKK